MALSRLRLLQNLPMKPFLGISPTEISLRYFSMGSNQPKTFTFTYLRESLGFSERNAFKASKFVSFYSPENPDRFVSVMKSYGFTQAQISDIARRIPDLLIAETEKHVVPVLEYFRGLGFSDLNLTKMVIVYPRVVKLSLDDQIKPGFEFYRNLFNSDEKAMEVLRQWPHVMLPEFRKIAANVATLKDSGVQHSHIVTLVENKPKSLAEGSEKFRRVVREVSEIGYDPARINFVLAAYVSSTAGRERKGMACLDFLVNQPCLSENLPVVLKCSMKKKVIPRCSVLHHLLSNHSVEPKDIVPRKFLSISEKKFMKKYIRRFNDYKDPTKPNLRLMYLDKKSGGKKETGFRSLATRR